MKTLSDKELLAINGGGIFTKIAKAVARAYARWWFLNRRSRD